MARHKKLMAILLTAAIVVSTMTTGLFAKPAEAQAATTKVQIKNHGSLRQNTSSGSNTLWRKEGDTGDPTQDANVVFSYTDEDDNTGLAYCGTVNTHSPVHAGESHSLEIEEVHDEMIRKVLYYGYGGVNQWFTADMGGYAAIQNGSEGNEVAKTLGYTSGEYGYDGASAGWRGAAYNATHAALNRANAEHNRAVKTNGQWDMYKKSDLSLLNAFWAFLQTAPNAPDNFTAYRYDGGANAQDVFYGTTTITGSAKLVKTSANPSITNGNSCYSLNGAVYGIYSDKDCKTSVGTFTTKADGSSDVVTLAAGTYYVKEKTAPKGYQKDASVYPITVVSGETATVSVSDVPMNDPADIVVKKIGKQGNTPLVPVGTQFTLKYYDTYGSISGVTPKATWIIEAHDNGHGRATAVLDQAHLVSGSSALYFDNDGMACVPLGTLTIEESKPATGYTMQGAVFADGNHNTISSMPYTVQIKSVNDVVNMYAFNNKIDESGFIVEDTPVYGGLKILKKDADSGSTAKMKGAQFQIINANDYEVTYQGKQYKKGAVLTTLTIGSDGTASTGKNDLQYGSYTIHESVTPTGYTAAADQTIAVTEEGTLVTVNVSETRQVFPVNAKKLDAVTGTVSSSIGHALSGASFQIINNSGETIYMNGKAYANGAVIATVTTDASGTFSVNLPYGAYKLHETKAPTGYQLAPDQSFFVNAPSNLSIKETPISGGISIQKTDAETGSATSLVNTIMAGAVFEVRYNGSSAIQIGNKIYKKGEAILTLTTDASGKASTSNTALPYGDYLIVETKAPQGYTLADPVSVSISENGKIYSVGVQEKPIRGDYAFKKVGAKSLMPNAVFLATSESSFTSQFFDFCIRSPGPVAFANFVWYISAIQNKCNKQIKRTIN